MYYFDILKRELIATNGFLSERVVVDVHGFCKRVVVDVNGFYTELHFGVKAKGNQDKFLRYTGYLNSIAKPYKARFIASSSSCTTTELFKLLTSCLTAIKDHAIKYFKKIYERSGKKLFWSIKIQVKY